MRHYMTDAQIARDRMRQLRQNADRERLAQLAQVYRPGLSGRILAGLGNWMIARGTGLKMRYEDAASYRLPVSSYRVSAGMKAE